MCGRAPLLAALLVLVACSATQGSAQRTPAGFTPPDQLLVDKQTEFAAIVKVKTIENRWVILPDGDHFPLLVSECEMESLLSGTPGWPVGSLQKVAQFDYIELLTEAISPPAIEGQRYVLWGIASPKESEVPAITPWTAHPQGFLLIRGEEPEEFVFWEGKSYLLTALRDTIKAGTQLPLDQIADPVRRLKVARERVEEGQLGDEKAFVNGLLVNVLDPEGQARQIERPIVEPSPDALGMGRDTMRSHAIWYESLAFLRDVGKDERRRQGVVAALGSLVHDPRPKVRLAAALALVDLESNAGREVLLQGFEKDSGSVSSDGDDQMTFPGGYPYDQSSVTACAHALARLGDLRGLKHPNPEVQLATAQALKDRPGAEVEGVLRRLAKDGDGEVEGLTKSGALTAPRKPGDRTGRYPSNWVNARSLLARSGDDESLRLLVEAYLADAGTYPLQEAPLMPRGQLMSWGGASVAGAIQDADAAVPHLLERLATLYARDARWNGEALKGLRDSLARPESEEARPAAPPSPTEAELKKRLADPDANRRAEALAAAGYHKLEGLYEELLATALKGRGVERNAAIYGLGFYEREVPEAALRQLVAADDSGTRFAAIELATRRQPGRFAVEVMDLLRAMVKQARIAKPDDWQQQRGLAYMPRIVCRLTRGPLPPALVDGLMDSEPQVRRLVVEALRLGGNPAAVASLEKLRDDPDPEVQMGAHSALRALGRPDRP